MEQFKRAKVVMLPTNDISNLCLGNNLSYVEAKNEKTLSQIWEYLKQRFPYKPQHLYIISDDEIKEGDLHITSDHEGYGDKKYKIIATTDSSLKIFTGKGDICDLYYNLPQPSQQFIEKYIEEYNKGNIITDVLVEYEHYDEFGNYISGDIVRNNDILRLKINSKDNTITIRKVKDNWSREEVIKILKSFEKDIENSMDSDDDGNTFNNINSDKWVEENL